MFNYIVKIRNTRTNEYRIVVTPKFSTDYEARNFIKNRTCFDKYEDMIVEICAFVDLR